MSEVDRRDEDKADFQATAHRVARASLRLRDAAKAYEEAPADNDDAERWEYDDARAVSDYYLDAYARLISEAAQSDELRDSSGGGAA